MVGGYHNRRKVEMQVCRLRNTALHCHRTGLDTHVLCDMVPTGKPGEAGLKSWCFWSDDLEFTHVTGLLGLSLNMPHRALWKIRRHSGG